MCELLAPAGSYEGIKAAVNAGADAVYAGGLLFGARAYADNPDEEHLIRGIEYCHLHGRKLYLTVNTLLKERELETELEPFLRPYYENGLDGLIVQDFGVLRFARERFPELPVHASTQMTVTGAEGARLLQAEGVPRVVTARELSLEEISKIIEETGVEVEVFIHGAMCYSYSGQCLFSSLLGGRSGNRGRCAQPCRLPYRVTDRTDRPQYLLSMKDMCALELLPELLEAGVASLKIEGRMKRPEYTAGVVSVYRKYLDLYKAYGKENCRVEDEDREFLLELYSRSGFSQGYFRSRNGRSMITMERPSYGGVTEARQGIRERYLENEIKEKISGTLAIPANGPAVLKLRCRDAQAECSLEIAQPAQNRPTDADTVRRQMMKTGNTPFAFEKLDIELAEGLFLPIAGLNKLRRTGIDLLECEILGRSRRTAGESRETADPEERQGIVERCPDEREPSGRSVCALDIRPIQAAENGLKQGAGFRTNVLVTTEAQLEALLEFEDTEIDTVYLDSLLLATLFGAYGKQAQKSTGQETGREQDAVLRAESLMEQLKRRGWNCFLNTPAVLRDRERAFLADPRMQTILCKMDGFLLHTVDELSYFEDYIRKNGLSAKLAADDNLYAYNRRAADFLRDHGVGRFTLPAELNHRELGEFGRENAELVVYGYQALMQSAQCVMKNTKGCTKVPAITYLKDRKNAEFPVLNRCPFCYNTIYNSVPLMLVGCREEILRLSPAYLRLSFTVESGEETKRILQGYGRLLSGETPTDGFSGAGTRGHFKRGVE